jgi:hypothetical protein
MAAGQMPTRLWFSWFVNPHISILHNRYSIYDGAPANQSLQISAKTASNFVMSGCLCIWISLSGNISKLRSKNSRENWIIGHQACSKPPIGLKLQTVLLRITPSVEPSKVMWWWWRYPGAKLRLDCLCGVSWMNHVAFGYWWWLGKGIGTVAFLLATSGVVTWQLSGCKLWTSISTNINNFTCFNTETELCVTICSKFNKMF